MLWWELDIVLPAVLLSEKLSWESGRTNLKGLVKDHYGACMQV